MNECVSVSALHVDQCVCVCGVSVSVCTSEYVRNSLFMLRAYV